MRPYTQFTLPKDLYCMLRCLCSASLLLIILLGALPAPPPTHPVPTEMWEEPAGAIAVSLDLTLCAFSDDLTLELLARVLAAEVGDRSYAAQTAYAAMLLNRRTDPHFPADLGAVIGDAGLRIARGEIPARSLRAASAALRGVDPTAGAVYCHPAGGTAPQNPTATFDGLVFSR